MLQYRLNMTFVLHLWHKTSESKNKCVRNTAFMQGEYSMYGTFDTLKCVSYGFKQKDL